MIKALSIQVQPHRAPGLDVEGLRALFDGISTTPLVVRHQFDEGEDKGGDRGEDDDSGRYLNFTFGTHDLSGLWKTLRERVYADRTFGEPVAKSSIATCEGPHGWDDYLLLHHFDPNERCDVL